MSETTPPRKPAARRAPRKSAAAATETPVIETVAPETVEIAAAAAEPVAEVTVAAAEPVVEAVAETVAPIAEPVVVEEPVVAAEPVAVAAAEPVAAPVVTEAAPAEAAAPCTPTTTGFVGMSDLTEFGRANFDALVEANTNFTKGVEQLSKEVLTLAKSSLEHTTTAAKALLTARTLKDAMALNADWSKQSLEKLMADSGRLSELSVKLATDTLAPLTARVTATVGKVLKVAA